MDLRGLHKLTAGGGNQMSTVLEQVQVRTERKRWLAHDVERNACVVPTLFLRALSVDAGVPLAETGADRNDQERT